MGLILTLLGDTLSEKHSLILWLNINKGNNNKYDKMEGEKLVESLFLHRDYRKLNYSGLKKILRVLVTQCNKQGMLFSGTDYLDWLYFEIDIFIYVYII